MSANERTFYICQSRPDGKGDMDILLAKCNGDNKWGEFNRVRNVNTDNNEITVSIAIEEGKEVLYFSSDGKYDVQPAFGGYDIYRYDLYNGQIENIGVPINTPNNDLYYIAVPSFPDHAYYSSERVNEKGAYDIYFVEYKTIRE
jgi:hypothetical protein